MKDERPTGWLKIQPRIKVALFGTTQNNERKNGKSGPHRDLVIE
jgi:hypothetical protein